MSASLPTGVDLFAEVYSLFSWEYPNRQGIGCNTISSQDSSNFLAFLQALRAEPIGENIVLSAAVGLNPFMGPDGTPLDDVSQFAKVLDFVSE